MIIGLGIDIVELYRIKNSVEKFGMSFVKKILHPDEIACKNMLEDTSTENIGRDTCIAFLASRFAAKEACVKALGTGFSDGISLQDIQIISLPSGQPELRLFGKALDKFQTLGDKIHISITHGKDNAAAVVILEKTL